MMVAGFLRSVCRKAFGVEASGAGILLNPNTEFPLNFVPIHSFGAYLAADGIWDSRESFLEG